VETESETTYQAGLGAAGYVVFGPDDRTEPLIGGSCILPSQAMPVVMNESMWDNLKVKVD